MDVQNKIEVDQSHIFYLNEDLVIDFKVISRETKKDLILNQIIGFCLHGWPEAKDTKLICYYQKEDQLHVVQECLLWDIVS